ncbi:2014_t:CDS:2, partial [Gigaspora rosea]
MLFAEYTDDVVASQSICAIKSRKDSLWSLATELWGAFTSSDPKTHPLFKDVPELNEEGIANILSFYETSKSHFQNLLAQDTKNRVNIPSQASQTSQTSVIQQEKDILDGLFESEELSEAKSQYILETTGSERLQGDFTI